MVGSQSLNLVYIYLVFSYSFFFSLKLVSDHGHWESIKTSSDGPLKVLKYPFLRISCTHVYFNRCFERSS